MRVSILRPRGTERAWSRGRGSLGRGLGVWCPDVWVPGGQSVLLPCLSGLLSLLLTEARCQQPTPAPLPEHLLHPTLPPFFRRTPGGWWHCKGLPPP